MAVVIANGVYLYVSLPHRADGGSSGLCTINCTEYHGMFFFNQVQEFVQSTKYTSTSIVPADGIKMITQKHTEAFFVWG
jgi:hypothetical protein